VRVLLFVGEVEVRVEGRARGVLGFYEGREAAAPSTTTAGMEGLKRGSESEEG